MTMTRGFAGRDELAGIVRAAFGLTRRLARVQPAEVVDGADQQEAAELGMILEDNTREQAERTAAMPFIYPHQVT